MNRTEKFIHHRSGVHDSKDFLINADGITAQTLIDTGGSGEDFEESLKKIKTVCDTLKRPPLPKLIYKQLRKL